MIYAIISDIHANQIALKAVLEDAKLNGAEKIICLGDVVGYGPEPEKAVSAIRHIATVSLAGNHDDAVSGRLDPSDFIDLAADAVMRHREELSSENLEWLRRRPYIFKEKSFACAHGDFTDPAAFEYISDETEAKANFSARTEQLLFVGHSHIPEIFLTGASGRVYRLDAVDFTLEDGKRYIVNPGSVGYPRTEGNVCESTYVLYDEEESTVTFRRLPFTVRSVMQTGRNPKRIRRRAIAAATIAAALAAGSAAWFLSPDERVETVTEIITNNVTRVVEKTITRNVVIEKVDRHDKITLPNGSGRLNVKIKLAKNSPSAHIQLLFLDNSGNTAGEERWTVKRSKKASIKIPFGATKAVLSAGRTSGDKPAEFNEFNLELE